MLLAVRLQSHHTEMYIDMAKREAEGSHIMLGAQKRGPEPVRRILTGETSAAMLKDIGAQYIIIGHSETSYLPQRV